LGNRSPNELKEACQYYYPDLACNTSPDDRTALPLRRYWWSLRRQVWYISIVGPRKYVPKMIVSTSFGRLVFRGKRQFQSTRSRDEVLQLKPGEWVEVRSPKEIFATLDSQGKSKGLRFTPEMLKFCGKRFRVYKTLGKILLEATGELRKIKTPTVLLEGVFCDGKAHGGCDRSCFCFWREAWLKRVSLG
jgi:hypothetical protein